MRKRVCVDILGSIGGSLSTEVLVNAFERSHEGDVRAQISRTLERCEGVDAANVVKKQRAIEGASGDAANAMKQNDLAGALYALPILDYQPAGSMGQQALGLADVLAKLEVSWNGFRNRTTSGRISNGVLEFSWDGDGYSGSESVYRSGVRRWIRF